MPYLQTDAYREPEEPRSSLGKFLTIGVLGIVVVVAVATFFRLQGSHHAVSATSPSVNEAATVGMLAKIARHITLPTDETPLLGFITNADALRSQQPFFALAENGDVIAVYQRYKQAVLYRPSRDILVNRGALVFPPVDVAGVVTAPSTPPQLTNTSAPSVVLPAALPEPLKIDIRNGSVTVGVAAQLGKVLSSDKASYNVVSVAPASRTTYHGVTLVILTTSNQKQIDALKKKITPLTVVDRLPSGEKNSTADGVIIIGN